MMREKLPDNTVLIIIFSTIILIFSLIFLSTPHQKIQPDIEWREPQMQSSEMIQL